MADTKRKRVHRTRAEITEILEEFDVSGMSAARFATTSDFPISTFRLWLRRRAEEFEPASPSRFVPVKLAETEPSMRARIEITLANGRSLSVPIDIDPVTVAGLLAVVDGACS